jgi:hypothetical protein
MKTLCKCLLCFMIVGFLVVLAIVIWLTVEFGRGPAYTTASNTIEHIHTLSAKAEGLQRIINTHQLLKDNITNS